MLLGSPLEDCAEIPNELPSGVHARPSVFISVKRRSGPPSGEIRNTPWPCPSRMKAICRPSGDQTGHVSEAGLVVRRTGSPAGTILTYMSLLSRFGPFQLNATSLPSGEKLAKSATPLLLVNGTTFIGT